jgi:hypothetical protein
MSDKQSHVYVIGSSRIGPLKIGITTAPVRRLKEVQTGHPQRLEVFWSMVVRPDQAAGIEREVHDRLASARLSGEWFHVPVEVAVEAILRLTERLRPHDMTEVFPGLYAGEVMMAAPGEVDEGPRRLGAVWGWVGNDPGPDPAIVTRRAILARKAA